MSHIDIGIDKSNTLIHKIVDKNLRIKNYKYNKGTLIIELFCSTLVIRDVFDFYPID